MFDIFSFLSPKREFTSGEVDRLFTTLYGFIENQNLAASIWQEYLKIKNLSEIERDWAYVKIYLSLERFILSNKPPVVRNEFTRESLKSALSLIIKAKDLPLTLRLLFADSLGQIFMLFQLGVFDLSTLLINSLGVEKLAAIVLETTKGTILEGMKVNKDGKFDLDEVVTSGRITSPTEALATLRNIFKTLLSHVQNAFGAAVPEETVKRTFAKINTSYDYETISKFFDFLPEGILENERTSFLSREELERKVEEAVRGEREKKEEAERLAAELEHKVTELEESKKRLEKVNEVMVGREIMMRELKKENERLKAQHPT